MTITWQSAQARKERVLADAYESGLKTGRLDRALDIRSEYSLAGAASPSFGGYRHAYGLGYRAGLLALKPRNPWR